MNGKQLSDAAVELAHLRGYRAAHFSPARVRDSFITNYAYDSKGFPDLILVGPKVIAVEVKGDNDRLSDEQRGWLDAFVDAGVEAIVLTTKAYKDGLLEERL